MQELTYYFTDSFFSLRFQE